MNQENPSSSSTRKSKFTPKAPKRRPPTRSSQPRSSGADSAVEDADSELLLKRFQEKQGQRHTNDKKSSVRVAFGPGAPTPATTTSQKRKPIKDETMEDVIKDGNILGSGVIENLDETIEDILIESNSEEETYTEPWNYERSYYPTTLPMRRPHSGNPGILDEFEFGEAAFNKDYKENYTNAAARLGFLDESKRESLLFFQLPHYLPPSLKESESSNKGKEPIGQAPRASSRLMGKLLVYNSGITKLKLGETLYDVYPGSGGDACEHVMAVNYKAKDGCLLGQVENHAVVSLDVNSILDGLTGE